MSDPAPDAADGADGADARDAVGAPDGAAPEATHDAGPRPATPDAIRAALSALRERVGICEEAARTRIEELRAAHDPDRLGPARALAERSRKTRGLAVRRAADAEGALDKGALDAARSLLEEASARLADALEASDALTLEPSEPPAAPAPDGPSGSAGTRAGPSLWDLPAGATAPAKPKAPAPRPTGPSVWDLPASATAPRVPAPPPPRPTGPSAWDLPVAPAAPATAPDEDAVRVAIAALDAPARALAERLARLPHEMEALRRAHAPAALAGTAAAYTAATEAGTSAADALGEARKQIAEGRHELAREAAARAAAAADGARRALDSFEAQVRALAEARTRAEVTLAEAEEHLRRARGAAGERFAGTDAARALAAVEEGIRAEQLAQRSTQPAWLERAEAARALAGAAERAAASAARAGGSVTDLSAERERIAQKLAEARREIERPHPSARSATALERLAHAEGALGFASRAIERGEGDPYTLRAKLGRIDRLLDDALAALQARRPKRE